MALVTPRNRPSRNSWADYLYPYGARRLAGMAAGGDRCMRTLLALPFLALAAALSQPAPAAEPARSGVSVLGNHRDLERSGHYIVPSLTFAAARRMHRDARFRAPLEGPIYAQPLYWLPVGGGRPLLIAVSERDVAYALDAASGAVTWRRSLGMPTARGALPCGNIGPLGITGTPVIDERRAALYLDAVTGGDNAEAVRHLVYALSLKDGAVLPGWPVDVEQALHRAGKSFHARNQNQRGALALVGDRVYVPYGGHFGDCASYRGWVIGIALGDPRDIVSWSTRAAGGGIWAPGGIASDGKALYVTTGNTMGARDWGDGEALIRLGLDLSYGRQPAEYFAPPDWRALDEADLDLGATNPILFDLPGGKPSALALTLGKDGKAYLLDRHNLGGIGGSLRAVTVARNQIHASPAAFPTKDGVYVVFQADGAGCPGGKQGDLTALKITPGAPPDLRVAWCADEHGEGAPIVTTTDGRSDPIVWVVGAEGDNRLRGFRGDTGEPLFDGGGAAEAMPMVQHFQTPIAAGRHIYVASDSGLYAFAP
jgi:hypothetical protein